MELFNRILEIVDANLIYCLIPMLLILMSIEGLFKNRFETKKVLNLIRWTIIIYALISLIYFLVGTAMHSEDFPVTNRAKGVYRTTYWMLFITALILPFTLIIKKLGSTYLYVLFVAFCMKIGFYFEHFVILVTSYHRDYMTESGNADLIYLYIYGIGIIFLQALVISIIVLGIFEMMKRKRIVIKKA